MPTPPLPILEVPMESGVCPDHGEVIHLTGYPFCPRPIKEATTHCPICGGEEGKHKFEGCTGEFTDTRPCGKRLLPVNLPR